MKKSRLQRLLTSTALIALSTMMTFADIKDDGKVKIQYEVIGDGGIKIINVWNRTDKTIKLKIDDTQAAISPYSSAQTNIYAGRYVIYDWAGGGRRLWMRSPDKKQSKESQKVKRIRR